MRLENWPGWKNNVGYFQWGCRAICAGTAEQTVMWLRAAGPKQHLGLQYFSDVQANQLTTCEAGLASTVS